MTIVKIWLAVEQTIFIQLKCSMRLKQVGFFDDKYINLFTVQTHLLVEAFITYFIYVRLTNMHHINISFMLKLCNPIGWKFLYAI